MKYGYVGTVENPEFLEKYIKTSFVNITSMKNWKTFRAELGRFSGDFKDLSY